MKPAKWDYVIGGDPGSKNFGVAVYRKSRLLGTKQLQYPINDLKHPEFLQQISNFRKEWRKLFKLPGNNLLVLERFMIRGPRIAGAELANVMLGMLAERATKSKWTPLLVTPAIWKNEFHRNFNQIDLKEFYKEFKASPHCVDAALIGRFGLDKYQNFKISSKWKNRLENELSLLL